MKLRNLYMLNTALGLVFALGLLLMTPLMLKMFGMDNTNDAQTLAKFLAAELTVSALITLFALDVTDFKARRAINLANIAGAGLGCVVALNATLSGVMSGMGWLVVVIYAVIALGFAYFQFLGLDE